MITREKLHKHFYYIIRHSKGLESNMIIRYIDDLSEKLGMSFEDVMEEFVTFWKKAIKERG